MYNHGSEGRPGVPPSNLQNEKQGSSTTQKSEEYPHGRSTDDRIPNPPFATITHPPPPLATPIPSNLKNSQNNHPNTSQGTGNPPPGNQNFMQGNPPHYPQEHQATVMSDGPSQGNRPLYPPSPSAQYTQSVGSTTSGYNSSTTPCPPSQFQGGPNQHHGGNYEAPAEVVLTDRGTQMKLHGDLDGAMQMYIKASDVNSEYAPAYYNIGVIYSELNRYEDALNGYQSALKRNPYYVEAYCNIGVIYKNTGKLKSAAYYYKKALAVNPNFKIARNNMAIVLTDLGTQVKHEGNLLESIEHYKQALVFNALYPDAYYNLGVAYAERGDFEKAIISYELAIHFNPLCCEAYNNLGVIFKDGDNLDRANECYQSALQINSRFPQTLNNLAVIFTMQGRITEAYNFLGQALEVNPRYAEAYNNLGVLCRDEGRLAEAIFCYDQSLRYNSNSQNAAQNRLLAMNYCNSDNNPLVFRAHEEWSANFQSVYQQFTNYLIDHNEDKNIRVGYISPDFFLHSISYFFEGIITHHNKSKFSIFCYANVMKEDSVTQRLRANSYQWRNIYNRPAKEVAKIIYEDKIDILVDLSGHTAGNRLDVLAMKPAPIQITYLGYPNTTGLRTIDYLITDNIASPQFSQQEFTEDVIQLPHCFLTYTPPGKLPDVSPVPLIKNNHITFGSFSNLAKFSPDVLSVWANILCSIPNSRLILKCKPFVTLKVRHKMFAFFTQRGVDASRVELLPLTATNYDHMATYGRIDIALDPFPYSGMTTTCEALIMGVPVLTMRGNSFAHNITTSILHHLNLSNWTVSNEEDYIRVAMAHSQNTELLQHLRRTLRRTLLDSVIGKPDIFVKELENTYHNFWLQYLSSQNDM